MERRTYLRSLGAAGAGAVGTAGCLGRIRGGDDRTVLGPPDQERGDPSHPVHGEEFPSFSVPDPLAGETVTAEEFEGERSVLMTFFFTSCPDGACPALIQKLVQTQIDATENGYGDDIALLALTFDPDVDTADELEAYAEEFGIDLTAGNWHFLRPENNEAAKELVDEEFGVPIEQVPIEESETHGDGDHANHDHEYTFTHVNLILLANEDGIVERAYPRGTQVATETVLEDVETVVSG